MSKRKKTPSKERKEETELLVEEETPVVSTPITTESEEGQSVPRDDEAQSPNAERVTVTAIEFLRRLGNRRSLRPRRVSREGEVYTVEVGLKKGTAMVQIDAATDVVREYEISEEEGSSFFPPLSPKTMLFICGIATLLFFLFSLLDLQSLLSGILH